MAVAASKPKPEPTGGPVGKNLTQLSKFWISNKGRNVVTIMTGVTAGLYFGGYMAVHAWFLPKFRDTVQLYRNGFLTPLTAGVFERAKNALADLNMFEKENNLINFFNVYGMDLFFAGSTKTRQGSIIGIPRNYSYNTTKEIEKNDIIVNNHNVEWGSEGGQMLQDALILSENAQKFGIARNIALSDTHHVFMRGGMGSVTIMLYYFLSRNANEMLYGLYKPRSFRIVVYSGLSLFCFGIWAVSSDILTKFYENYADKRAGSINLNYAKGGVEFYSKTLQRNMGIRSLMGPSGEKLFTFFGNDVEFLRQRHVPYTKRKSNLEKIAERLSQEANNNLSSNLK